MLLETENLYVEETSASRRHARGPLRPEQLLSVRKRRSRRLAGHRFRVADTLLVVVVSMLVLHAEVDGPLIETSVADAVPVAGSAWAMWWLMRSMGLYRFARSERLLAHLARLAAAASIAAAAGIVVHWLTPAEQTSTADVFAGVAACFGVLVVAHALWWGLVGRWRALGWLTPNVVVVGATAHAEDLLATAIERRDMNVLGIFDDRRERSPLAMLGVPVLGDTDAMLRHRVMPYVDLIVVTIDPAATSRVRQVMGRLAVLPNQVTLVFDDPTTARRAAAIDQLADSPLVPPRPRDPNRRAFAKRVQDLVIGIPLLVVVSPLMALIALAVRLDSPGPVFFRQRRHGFNNEEIVVWKFRTMRHEASDAKAERQVTANDDRVTRVGRFLRTTSLDEVPQLFNVIAGEMSLVGPRPHAIGMKTGEVESAQLVAEYAHRHRITPGMTGWAAINGSRGPLHDPEAVTRRVLLDVDYIERQSLWLDLYVLAMTIPRMLGDRAAIR